MEGEMGKMEGNKIMREKRGKMGELGSPSRDGLSSVLSDIYFWRLKFPNEVNYFRWCMSHPGVVRRYVVKLDLNSHWRVLRAANFFKEPFWFNDRQRLGKYPPLVAYFTQELQEFFIVPSSDQISDRKNTLKKSELVAAFINFLLQLLYHKTDLIDPFTDRIESLQKDLIFLITVLGDPFLLRDELEQVQNLLMEFEAVANEAGILVHSLFFSTVPVFQIMNEDLDLLFVHIRHLNDGIVELSNLPPFVADTNMTSKVADSLFSVDSFVCDLEDLLNQDIGLTENVKSRIKMLHQDLMHSLSFLKDMKKMTRNSEMEGLKEAEVRIKDVAYESEYLINSFLVGDVRHPYFSNRLSHVIHKIELVEDGLQEFKRNSYSQALQVGEHSTAQLPVQAKKSSQVEDTMVGLEESTTHILDQLVGGTDHLQIISIFGMPGLGKTTLAKKLYNHRSVNDWFDKRMWCVVSQTYQMHDLLIDILSSSGSEFDKAKISNMGEETLGEHIYKSLKGRRYLIVMDDIWDSDAWYELQRFFPDDGNGSRILFTSRNREVARPNSQMYQPSSLTEDQCWELLKIKVFQNEPCPPELLEIGKKIAANCGGLPLTVVVVAGILSTLDEEESAWRKVGRDLASYLFLGGDNMMQILGLSYKHLPEHLKPCFLYFGAFPEDTEIPTRKLMRLWIAEGFVHKELRKSPETIAEEYLMELINKSLVIVAKRRKNGGVKTCLIHDLLRDFCLKICQEENFLKFVDNNDPLYEKGQRLVSLRSPAAPAAVIPFGQHVRSFHGRFWPSFYVFNMRRLRVLDFKAMDMGASLIGIGYLINLRYLVIDGLSELIGKLVNLEYLRVEKCYHIVRVPSVILKMVKLRHLHISCWATFEEECSSSHTNELEVFSKVIIKKQKDEDILKCSPNLRKLKCSYEPFEEDRGEDRNLDLQLFTQLESLNMDSFGHRIGEINFPLNVKKLTLRRLYLPWEKMQIIGRLPFLEFLNLGFDAFVGKTWETRDDEFQRLRFLKLRGLMDLAEWHVSSSKHFPMLEGLVVHYCHKLQGIPTEIGGIVTLQVLEVRFCPKEVEESAIEIQKIQREMGNDELNVILGQFSGGGEKDSSSRGTLYKLLGDIIQWRHIFPDEANFQWSGFHPEVVRDYVMKLDLNSDCRVLRAAHLLKPLWWNENRQSLRKYKPIVAYFTQELQEFFIVPRPDQICDRENALKKNELVAAFINFLLLLLYDKSGLIGPFEDRMDSLQKELRFLLTVLGDAFLLRDELEQVQNLLTEFEAVATEAGILVHSFFFSRDPVFQIMNEGLDLLFVHIRHLNDGIVELSKLPPFVADTNMTSKVAEVNSLFTVDSFLCDLEDLLNQDNGLTENVKSQIKILHEKLLSFLKDMKKMTRNSEMDGLKEAEVRIKDVAYESEYLINSFLVGDVPLFVGDDPFPYFSKRLSHVIQKIKLVEDGLQEIKRNYYSQALEVGKPLNTQQPVQAKKNSEVEDIIVGFEGNTTRILDQLVGGTYQLQIISIFGMPGLGKTTLAKELYNHRSVNDWFDRCIWCVVSQTYQKRNLLTDILISLESLDKAKNRSMEEELLGEHIYKSLNGRRYLIVMDDIWDSDAWYELQRFFPDDGNGSRILFTSRNREVAPPNSPIYQLPSLTEDQCWELLKIKVFQNEPCPPELLEIGKEIAANCGGLPLTVVVVAGILSTLEEEESAWRKVGGDLASYLFLGGDYMMQILGLSYKHLSEHLKPCFLYFGAFPEDTEIPTRKLMKLWIAEGFVPKEPTKSSEIIAEEYLMELINKSLVIVAKRRTNGGIKTCLIHDLLRDFCLKICQGENFLKFVDNNYSLYEKGQRLVSLEHFVHVTPFGQHSVPFGQHVPSFHVPFGQHVRSFHGHFLESRFYVLNMRLLRVLDFESMYDGASLIGIEYLSNLRYLVINELSALIGKLVNLEYLRVEKYGMVRVPSVILKMVKLRHLQIHFYATFEEECSSSHTNKLEVFSHVIIKEQKDEDILKCSPNLRKLKCIYEPFEEFRVEDRNVDLQLFTQLESLNIDSSGHRIGEINFPLNVKKLTLRRLYLPWEKMQIIGRLPFLEVLKLVYHAFEGKTWETRDDEFQQLRFLELCDLDLAEWHVSSSEHFPRLERLEIYECLSLQGIPTEIGDISTLQVIEVRGCPKEVEESAIEIQKVQREMGNDELKVILDHTFDFECM